MLRWPAGLLALLLLAACGDGDPAGDTGTVIVGRRRRRRRVRGPPQSFTLVATGDVLIHQDLELTAGAPPGRRQLRLLRGPRAGRTASIRDADLAICHLETPVAPPGGPYRGYPSFAVQPEIVRALAGAGYDLCSTASNHSLDDGDRGLARTLDDLDAAGIAHAGTYRTQADSQTAHDRRRPRHQGRRTSPRRTASTAVARRPTARGRWTSPTCPTSSGMLAAAARAKAAGAEVVIASLHCCVEYEHDPTDAQVAAVHTLLASPDIDLVLGHHAHVVQPFEQIGGEWVAYGLGNFVAEMAQEGDPYDEVAARFTFTRGADGRFTVTKAEAVPAAPRRRRRRGCGWTRPTPRPSNGWPRWSVDEVRWPRGWPSSPAEPDPRTRLESARSPDPPGVPVSAPPSPTAVTPIRVPAGTTAMQALKDAGDPAQGPGRRRRRPRGRHR